MCGLSSHCRALPLREEYPISYDLEVKLRVDLGGRAIYGQAGSGRRQQGSPASDLL